ncbi:hypothetical protein [Streptomyces sp. AS02]|uniref:hypothetical protein n=1 Tax=Streptomyces sp. AS02 TaxID=2938946 RepID=UPI002020309B|nr:hypothetical protein [Streptomyces sp. AS02]MCL8016921.1 hypothetical protein [Streptomyces sp. AS02]
MTTAASYSPGIRSAAARRGITPAQYVAITNAGFKWCRTCNDWRPLTEYKPSTSTPDSVRPLCTRHYNPPDPVPITHGITGYRRGCRCADCRKANTNAQTRRKAARRADPTAADRAGHGKYTTYSNYGCRCAPCTQAQSRANKHYADLRKQRREEQTK